MCGNDLEAVPWWQQSCDENPDRFNGLCAAQIGFLEAAGAAACRFRRAHSRCLCCNSHLIFLSFAVMDVLVPGRSPVCRIGLQCASCSRMADRRRRGGSYEAHEGWQAVWCCGSSYVEQVGNRGLHVHVSYRPVHAAGDAARQDRAYARNLLARRAEHFGVEHVNVCCHGPLHLTYRPIPEAARRRCRCLLWEHE